MKKVIDYLIVIIFIGLLVVPTVLFYSIGEKEIELNEKRELATYPERITVNYIRDVDSWYKDNFAYRKTLISIYQKINQEVNFFIRDLFSNEESNKEEVIEGPIAMEFITVQNKKQNGFAKEEISTDYFMPIVDHLAIYGRNDWLFYYGDKSIDFYTGVNILDNKTMKEWLDLLVRLDELCKEKGVTFVYYVAPNKEQVYSQYMPSYTVVNEFKREQVFYEYVKKNSDVNFIYPLDKLSGCLMYKTYYKQDTHWNNVGAFIGVMQLYKEIGLSSTTINKVEVKKVRMTGGDLSDMCGYKTTYDDYIVEYKTNVEVNLKDSGSKELKKYVSSIDNDYTCMLLGDSFRTNATQYLAKDFKTTYVAHRDGFDNVAANILLNLKENDLLILMSVERYDMNNIKMVRKIVQLLENN